jgi:hypothetical protein
MMQEDNLDQPHGTYTHAYKHLLIGWIVDFTGVGEGGGEGDAEQHSTMTTPTSPCL